ncbi:O-antigen polymerase [Salinicoccus sp. Marseille-QA3877]
MSWSGSKKIVINLIYFLYFLRFVVLNFMVVYTGWYTGRGHMPPAESSYDMAVALMGVEFILINIFYFLFLKDMDINLYRTKLNLKLNHPFREFVYMLFIIFTILVSPLVFHELSFLGLGVDENVGESNQLQNLIFFCVYISKYLLIGFALSYFYKQYSKSRHGLYVFFSVVFVLAVNSIFIGVNRMDVILPFVASFLVLNYLYKRKMILYNFISVFFLVTSLYLISQIRGTFEYRIVEDTAAFITDNLQVYMGGVYNVALSMELDPLSNQNPILTLLYDIVRPFLGLNLLWRSDTLETSTVLFNERIFGEGHVSQIIPFVGQFHYAFGIVGNLFSVILFTATLYILLKYLKGTYLFTSLIIIVIMLRMLITPLQNISIFINEFSSIILIFVSLNIYAFLIRTGVENE